jgi:cell wall assembly regulator SMI1
MEIEDSNKYGVLQYEALEDYEKSLGTSLPTDYREFLILYNGGTPEKYLVCWPGSDEPSEVWNDSLGLHNGPAYSRLDLATEGLKEYLPKGIIPFATDPGGNSFCIGVSGEYRGKIYFWDHEQAQDQNSISLLGNSFTEFVANLVGEENA